MHEHQQEKRPKILREPTTQNREPADQMGKR